MLALLDRILAEARADGALLDDGERRRQRAGAQQDREVVGALDGEAAGDLAGAAEDRLADHRRRDHLVVEHDGERLADILLRHLGELRAPDVLKRKMTIGSLVRWSKPGCASVRSSPDTRTRFSIRYGGSRPCVAL